MSTVSNSDNEFRNPCTYKSQCKMCALAEVDDRPVMCESLECRFYTPCKECSRNKSLNENGLCKICTKEETVAGAVGRLKQQIKHKKLEIISPISPIVSGLNEHEADIEDSLPDVRVLSLTLPGQPPPELKPNEVEYFNKRWGDYKGYYRDPAAYFICHTIILEEINLTHIQSLIAGTRGEANIVWSKQKEISIRLLRDLKGQLPEKEAQDISDDEKSLAGIYDSYLKESGLQCKQGVSRILTADAMALAPYLLHKVDLNNLLQRCGFQLLEIEETLERFELADADQNRGYTADEVAEFFGFHLKEKYALAYNQNAE